MYLATVPVRGSAPELHAGLQAERVPRFRTAPVRTQSSVCYALPENLGRPGERGAGFFA